jgi:hypothetical protein
MDPSQATTVEDGVERDVRTERLAELVHALTGCGPAGAWLAVQRQVANDPPTADTALEILARAMVSVSKGIDLRDEVPATEPDDIPA